MGDPDDRAEEAVEQNEAEFADETVEETEKVDKPVEHAAKEGIEESTEDTMDDGDESWADIDDGWDVALDPSAAEPPRIEDEDPPISQDFGQEPREIKYEPSKDSSEDISVDPDWQGEEAATVAVDKEDMAAVAVIADAISAEKDESERKPDDDEPITWQEDEVATVDVEKEVLDSMAADVKAQALQAVKDEEDFKDTEPVLMAIDDEIADENAAAPESATESATKTETEVTPAPAEEPTDTSESQRGLLILLVVLGIAALVLVIILIIVASRS
jgi:hypothetical protein